MYCKKKTEALQVLKRTGKVVNVERSNCMFMSCEQNVQQCDDINTGSASFKSTEKLIYLWESKNICEQP